MRGGVSSVVPPSTSAFFPAYNDARTLGALVEQVDAAVAVDETSAIIRALNEGEPPPCDLQGDGSARFGGLPLDEVSGRMRSFAAAGVAAVVAWRAA